MARIKGATMTHKRRKKMLKLAKGFYGCKSKHFKMAKQPLASFSIFLRRLWVMVAPLIRAIFYISFSCLNSRWFVPAARS